MEHVHRCEVCNSRCDESGFCSEKCVHIRNGEVVEKARESLNELTQTQAKLIRRLEDEIQNWRENYTRNEQERSHLANEVVPQLNQENEGLLEQVLNLEKRCREAEETSTKLAMVMGDIARQCHRPEMTRPTKVTALYEAIIGFTKTGTYERYESDGSLTFAVNLDLTRPFSHKYDNDAKFYGVEDGGN